MVGVVGKKVSSKLHKNVITQMQKPQILARWERREIQEDDGIRINWNANEKALYKTPITRRHLLTKQVSGMCRVGKMMKIQGKQEIDECPYCGEKETADHCVACRDPTAIQQFHNSVKQLDEWMVGAKIALEICITIKMAVMSWKDGQEYKPEPNNRVGLKEALEVQEQMGWQAFLKEYISTNW